MLIREEGSVRVDLLGGTLDLNPIHLILPNVVTLNVATSLKAQVEITPTDKDGVEIYSEDYQRQDFINSKDFTLENLRAHHFGPLTFVAYLLFEAGVTQGIHLKLASGSPAGAGLGGSSAMGVTLFKALWRFQKKEVSTEDDKRVLIQKVNSIEAFILDSGPAGYQDYYPAMFGGVLALKASVGQIEIEQLYTPRLAQELEAHVTLIHSGQTRLSGINNWEVYKAFFDKQVKVREGLSEIAALSYEAYLAIKNQKFDQLMVLIGKEGSAREKLFPDIVSPAMKMFYNDLKAKLPHAGMKVCGAGGGGTFLVLHQKGEREQVGEVVSQHAMKILDFKVEQPL